MFSLMYVLICLLWNVCSEKTTPFPGLLDPVPRHGGNCFTTDKPSGDIYIYIYRERERDREREREKER